MNFDEDDSLPPTLDGPYSPVREVEELMEEAPTLQAVMNRLPPGAKASTNGKQLMRKEPIMNKELDPELFNREGFQCMAASQAATGRFKAFRFIGQFFLTLAFGSAFPEDVLRSLFIMCLDYVVEGADGMKIAADHFIFLLTSRHLDYEIAVHFRKLDDKAVDTILTRFELVDQSNKSKERPSICEEPFVIDITAIQSRGGQPKMAGKGRPDFNIPYAISEGATYGLNNADNLCLFRAFEFLRLKVIMPHQRFSEYKKDAPRQLEDVRALCLACNIDPSLPFYSIEEYGAAIQAYYEGTNPGMFRLYCFETFGIMKPSWKADVADYIHELCVVFTDGEDDEGAGHYDAIKSIGMFFGTKNYCFGCEMPYNARTQHTTKCRWKCHNCQRVGVAFKGTCVDAHDDFFVSCLGCNKTFQSSECYDHHVKTMQRKVKRGKESINVETSICTGSKKCVDCGVIYQIRHHKQQPHVCGHKFCKVCTGYHAARECFIQYRPKVKKEKRIIFFDFECTTNFKPDPNLCRFKHQVNFCFAHVTCTRCIEKGIWDQELDRACGICGRFRTYAWAPFEFRHTDVDIANVVDDPLASFTKWILNFEADVLGLDPAEKKNRKRKHAAGNNSNNGDNMDMEADEDEDAENNWMLGYDEGGEKPVSVTTYAYAHAGSRYDNVLIYGEMLRMGVKPQEPIFQGCHILELKAQKRGAITTTVFRDSYKLIPIKLASFVKTFGLEIEGVENKKYFPHKYNKAVNYGTVLDTLPPIEDYYPGGMFAENRVKFEQWYEENVDTEFDLCEVIADYCKTDVQILAHGMVKMRQLFNSVTGHDITDSLTIPSACMKFFTELTKKDNERIAIIPHLGYEKRGKQSTIARKYLKWRAEEEMRENGRTLQHVDSPGGEHEYGNYRLDGMVERPDEDKNLAIEVNGCYWHACPQCFPDDAAIVGGGETAGAIRARDAKRVRAIAREFEVEIVWECQLMQQLEDNPAMKVFFDNTPDSGPIELHDAFFGGRTGPEWLGASVNNPDITAAHRTIKVKDFNSLYPSRNMFTNYPVGHPVAVQFDKDVDWRVPAHIVDDNGHKMEGIIKCFVVPPRHVLYDIPVLPLRLNKRTLFPLCRKCAEKYPDGKKDSAYICRHYEDADRGFTTTVSHIELEAALDAGYKVTRLFRAYLWRLSGDWSNGLFQSYLRIFLKMKFEASGYPANCSETGISDEESCRRKQLYIDNAKLTCQVELDADNIKQNPGMRYMSKLCLNSLWGRFALRNRLTKTQIVDCHAGLAKLLNDQKIDISSIDQLSEKFWMVCYKAKDEHVVEHDTSNVAIALWTTSAARIHLLDSLHKVYRPQPNVDRYDTRILYMDTDSIFYEYETERGDPLPGGEQLGELTDEYPNHTIVEFVCTGPKAYALWMRDNATGENVYKMKLRGITLDSDATQRISFMKMREMVLENWGQADNNVVFYYPDKNFVINKKKGEISTVEQKKQFNPTVNKGVIRDHGLKVSCALWVLGCSFKFLIVFIIIIHLFLHL